MRLPFCDQCTVNERCLQDLSFFQEITGNKRIPPETFCRQRYTDLNTSFDDFYRRTLVREVHNPTALYPVFPELAYCETAHEAFANMPKLPLGVSLMLTERCNLKCSYCYEVFSGNMSARSMSEETMRKAVDLYCTPEMLDLHQEILWDCIGGEVFIEFELLKNTVDYILHKHRELGICPKKIKLGMCTNGTQFHRTEVREWLEWLKATIGVVDVGLSLDGAKACHDAQRCNSFDRIMEGFDWWRATFPDSGTKGTICPATMPLLFENVRFFVEELKLPRFYINPTFEGPWTPNDANIYSEQLIQCAEYFLDRPEYDLLNNSNLLRDVSIRRDTAQNWCGCGTHMRAFAPDGTLYPCLRAATSHVLPIGDAERGECKDKLVPFYLYTKHNDDVECASCETSSNCPSCAIQWVEDTGDLYFRSKAMCLLTKVCVQVSRFYMERMQVEHQEFVSGYMESQQSNTPEVSHGNNVE